MEKQHLHDHMQSFIENATAATSKQRLVELHMKAVETNEKMYARANHNISFSMSMPELFPPIQRPVMAKRSMDQYKPIYISDLLVDNVHTGRILRGRVVAPAMVMMSLMTVFEDETGEAERFTVYNALPSGLEGPTKLAAARAYLKEGAFIAVLNPYYKTAMDGGRAIRVDDPSDLIFMDDVGPTLAIDLRVEVTSSMPC